MKLTKLALIALSLLQAALVFAPLASAQAIHLPPHDRIVLKNGLTVLLLEKHGVPVIALSGIVKTGAASDPADQAGLASVTAALLRKGTTTRTAQQFSADLDFIGGSFDADVTPDFTSIRSEFLTKDLAKGLELFADAVLHPTFPQNETDKMLAQNLDGVKAAKDQPQAVLGLYFNGYLFGATPYGHPPDGDELSLKRIHRDAIAKFYEENYAAGNTILAVAGEFDAADLRKRLEDTFGAWPARSVKTVPIPTTAPAKGKRLLLVDKPDATQTYFAIGNVGTAVNDPDRFAIRVVNTIFGGRFTSQLNEALRVESGYTYGAASFFDSHKSPGPFEIMSFTKNETTIPAMDLALEILDKLHKNGVTAEQLASAKAYIKGQYPPSIETSGQLARRILLDEFYGLSDDEVNQLEARIDAVTPEIANRIIENHFPVDNLVFALIGKASEIRPGVKKYADKMDERSISDPGFWPPPTAAAP